MTIRWLTDRDILQPGTRYGGRVVASTSVATPEMHALLVRAGLQPETGPERWSVEPVAQGRSTVFLFTVARAQTVAATLPSLYAIAGTVSRVASVHVGEGADAGSLSALVSNLGQTAANVLGVFAKGADKALETASTVASIPKWLVIGGSVLVLAYAFSPEFRSAVKGAV